MPDDSRASDADIILAAYAEKVREAFKVFAENLGMGQNHKSSTERFMRSLELTRKARDMALDAMNGVGDGGTGGSAGALRRRCRQGLGRRPLADGGRGAVGGRPEDDRTGAGRHDRAEAAGASLGRRARGGRNGRQCDPRLPRIASERPDPLHRGRLPRGRHRRRGDAAQGGGADGGLRCFRRRRARRVPAAAIHPPHQGRRAQHTPRHPGHSPRQGDGAGRRRQRPRQPGRGARGRGGDRLGAATTASAGSGCAAATMPGRPRSMPRCRSSTT